MYDVQFCFDLWKSPERVLKLIYQSPFNESLCNAYSRQRDVKVGVLPQEPEVIHFSRDEKNDKQHENKKFNPL